MDTDYERLQKCYDYVKTKVHFKPRVALVLGSGLGAYADDISIETIIPYADIPNFPVSTVQSHKGRFILGYIGDIPVIIMQGRVHFYEGYTMSEVVLPIRLMKLLGADILLLTNAAGSIDLTYKVGDFMLLTDHISSFLPSPLRGANIDKLGERFCDMTHTYDKNLQEIIKSVAKTLGITLKEGVYVQTPGPQFETGAEIAMYRILGAHAVGMSTACEAIAARHMGMKIGAISLISNFGAGITQNELTGEEVCETATEVADVFKMLITKSIEAIAKV